MSNDSNGLPAAGPPAASQPASPCAPAQSRVRQWFSTLLTLVLLYIVATPPFVYSAARTGVLRDISTEEDREYGPVDACIAPARWLYEDSPLKPVLQPWAEFWYEVLLT
jgi:hypothetical protein